MKVSFHTLGCKLNYAETASLERQFVDRGFSIVPFDAESNVCVINTCTVTERADRECRQIVRRALRRNPNAFIMVIGCYAQLEPEEISAISGVDLILGASEKFKIFDYTGDFRKPDTPKIFVSPIDEVDDFGIAHSAGVDGRTRAFLKIQDGCDYNCSFCTIPLARGASRSLPIDEIITQAGQLAEMEYHEVVLTGVNIGDYGTKINSSLLELLKALDPLPGLDRLRISSIEPNLLSDELLNYWINNPRICNHFHMPLQSGANEILRSMRRRYGAQQYAERVLLIKEMDPEAGIGVDVIVGYPGESDKLFEETYTFLHDLPISYLHVFTYSERPHTPSMQLPDRVDAKVRGERSERLRILSRKKRDAFYSTQQGRTARVVFESDVENNLLSGYTDNYVRVMVPYYEELINATAVVHLGEPTPEGMNAVIVRIERSAKTDKENNLVK